MESVTTTTDNNECKILDCEGETECKTARKEFFKNNMKPGKALGGKKGEDLEKT